MLHERTDHEEQRATAMATLGIRETPGVSGGYPCVGNTRVPVRVLVEDFRDGRPTVPALHMLYPDLSEEQIHNALMFYQRFPERVDEDIARNARAYDALLAR